MFTERIAQGLFFLDDLTKKIPFLDDLKREAIKVLRLRQESMVGIIGLDIDSSAIKLVKIDRTDPPFLIENISSVSLPSGAIVKEEIKNADLVIAALSDLIKQAQLTSKEVAVAIPRSLAFIKNITIDSRLTDSEIESRAWIEANRHFPDLVGDIYLDFSIIGPSLEDKTQLELMLVACRKGQIKPYLEVLNKVGLNAKIVDIDSYALERALSLITNTEGEATSVALLNLGVQLSTLIVIEGGNLVYAHDQSYDGQRLLTQSQHYLTDHGMGDGSEYVGLLEDSGYSDILKESLISHLRHTMHFFYASKPSIGLQRVYISGDCGTVPGIAEFIQKEINLETSIANPFSNLRFNVGIDKEAMIRQAPAFMLSCGLALSKIDY